MPHPLSSLGIAHTLISVLPVVAGLYAFARFRRIEPSVRSGRLYLIGLLLSVLTSFGLSSTGGLNPGHVLGVLALSSVGAGLLIPRLQFLGRARPYLAAMALSFSFFLLLVPGINETLTRLPAGGPLATGPMDPVVKAALGAWLLLFAVGVAAQAWSIRTAAKAQA